MNVGNCPRSPLFTFLPSGLEEYCRHGLGGRAGGCQTCGTHISVTAWQIFSAWSSVEFSRPVVMHCHGYLPICPMWSCPWAKNLSNLHKLGPDFAERISLKLLDRFTPFKVSWTCLDLQVWGHSYLPICPIWACPWAKSLSNQAALGPYFAEPISLKPLDGFIPFGVLWNCLDL